MWDDTTFQTLLRSNEKPPESLIPTIRQRLIVPAADLVQIDCEIHDLNKQLQNLRFQCDEIERSISHYRKIVAPLRLVPDDVLREIFLQCTLSETPLSEIPDHHTQLPQHGRLDQIHLPPILLTRICKRWRDVALTTPRLWSKIALTLPVPHPPIRDDDEILDALTTRGRTIMAREIERLKPGALPDALDAWLHRSGTTPLSISLPQTMFHHNGHTSRVHPTIHEGYTRLFMSLASHADRWQNLNLQINMVDFIDFNKPLVPHQLRNLIHLNISLQPVWSESVSWAQLFSTPLFGDLPSLRSLVWLSLDNTTSPRPYNDCVWNNLTDIHITNHADISNTVYVLERPSLVNCHIDVSDRGENMGPPSRRLIMPRIRTLFLCLAGFDNREDPALTYPFVYHISAPHLRKLTYNTEGSSPIFRHDPSLVETFPVFPLSSIMEEAPNLTELDLVVTPSAISEVKKALQLPKVPVERMTFGREGNLVVVNEFNELDGAHDFALRQLFPVPNWCSLSMQSTEEKFLEIARMGGDVLDQALDSCTCPNLKSLKCKGLQTISDDYLLSLVVFRLCLYKHAFSSRNQEDIGSSGKSETRRSREPVPLLELSFHFSPHWNTYDITGKVARFAELADMKDKYKLECKKLGLGGIDYFSVGTQG